MATFSKPEQDDFTHDTEMDNHAVPPTPNNTPASSAAVTRASSEEPAGFTPGNSDASPREINDFDDQSMFDSSDLDDIDMDSLFGPDEDDTVVVHHVCDACRPKEPEECKEEVAAEVTASTDQTTVKTDTSSAEDIDMSDFTITDATTSGAAVIDDDPITTEIVTSIVEELVTLVVQDSVKVDFVPLEQAFNLLAQTEAISDYDAALARGGCFVEFVNTAESTSNGHADTDSVSGLLKSSDAGKDDEIDEPMALTDDALLGVFHQLDVEMVHTLRMVCTRFNNIVLESKDNLILNWTKVHDLKLDQPTLSHVSYHDQLKSAFRRSNFVAVVQAGVKQFNLKHRDDPVPIKMYFHRAQIELFALHVEEINFSSRDKKGLLIPPNARTSTKENDMEYARAYGALSTLVKLFKERYAFDNEIFTQYLLAEVITKYGLKWVTNLLGPQDVKIAKEYLQFAHHFGMPLFRDEDVYDLNIHDILAMAE